MPEKSHKQMSADMKAEAISWKIVTMTTTTTTGGQGIGSDK